MSEKSREEFLSQTKSYFVEKTNRAAIHSIQNKIAQLEVTMRILGDQIECLEDKLEKDAPQLPPPYEELSWRESRDFWMRQAKDLQEECDKRAARERKILDAGWKMFYDIQSLSLIKDPGVRADALRQIHDQYRKDLSER
jgi:hypothetical protein